MSPGLTAPRGTADVLPQQAALRLRVEQTARELLESAGYGRIETPAFEATEVFTRGVGAATDIVEKEMYSFDDGGGRSLTLRPEGTAPVCRAYVEHGMHKLPAPVKLYYLESFFRAERPQAGRYRQFWQVGAEALGTEDPALDAELIVLLYQLLTRLGAGRLHLRLSSLGTPAARSEYRDELIDYLRANSERLSQTVRERIERNPLRAFDADDPSTNAVMEQAPRLLDRLPADDLEHFAEVRRLLESAGVAYEVDTTLVRGLDYYTRTVFEFTSDELAAGQSTVGAGGRYDGLVELLGGPPTPGAGWAAGVERILLASLAQAEEPPAPDLYVAHDGSPAAAFKLTLAARAAGISAQLELAGRSLKGQFKHAERLNARFVAVVDDDGVTLRDRSGGSERAVAHGDVVAELQQALGR
ncbi:MAG: histidine--tRNA ligase [Solirubrobacteraceae bacterium]